MKSSSTKRSEAKRSEAKRREEKRRKEKRKEEGESCCMHLYSSLFQEFHAHMDDCRRRQDWAKSNAQARPSREFRHSRGELSPLSMAFRPLTRPAATSHRIISLKSFSTFFPECVAKGSCFCLGGLGAGPCSFRFRDCGRERSRTTANDRERPRTTASDRFVPDALCP